MANRAENEKLERIVQREKPGFTIDKRARPKRPRKDADIPSAGTPDIDVLRAKAEKLLESLEGKVRARHDQAPGAGQATSADPADTDDNIRIVNIFPEHPDDSPDQLRKPRKVIISLKDERIIGEQG
jgi:hypothetical protein